MSGKLGGPDDGKQYRRVSSPLSPICSLFLAPSGTLYLKVQQVLAHGGTPDASPSPIVGKRRPGPKHPKYGVPCAGYLAHPFEKLVVFSERMCQVASTTRSVF